MGSTHPGGLRIAAGLTGASGAPVAAALLSALSAHPRVTEIHVTDSDTFTQVCSAECGINVETFLEQADGGRNKVRRYRSSEFSAPMASGSARLDAMVITPCSMGTLGAIAGGTGRNLLTRAAEVMLKEGRCLILGPRETPMSLIHLRNLVTAREAGATIMPFVPAFYQRPATIHDLLDQYIARVLDHLGLEPGRGMRWGEP